MARIVIALGGNAIETGQGKSTAKNQRIACEKTAKILIELIKQKHEIIIVHGNGPQVGSLLLQQEALQSDNVAEMPLDTLVAMTQGMIGGWLQQSLYNECVQHNLHTHISTIITHVHVEQNDPAFQNPTKYIGPFYQEHEIEQLQKDKPHWHIKKDADRGYRRVVPSPQPKKIIEQQIITDMLAANHVLITCGGGGIPVNITHDHSIQTVEAVIDKDAASTVLATSINADILLIVTAVEQVAINFGTAQQKNIVSMTCAEAQQYINEKQFPPGSMLPKIEACMQFVQHGGKAIITSLESTINGLQGKTGTEIIK